MFVAALKFDRLCPPSPSSVEVVQSIYNLDEQERCFKTPAQEITQESTSESQETKMSGIIYAI